MDVSRATAPLIVATVTDPAQRPDPGLAKRKNELYAEAIRAQGGNLVLLDSTTPAGERDRLLAAMSGLLLTGGPDLDPHLYGEAPAGATDVDSGRDELELEVWRVAARRGVPVLGVCRGLQAINVYSGGKLLQEVAGHMGAPYGSGPARTHILEIEPRSKLGRAIASAAPDGVAGADPEDDSLELEVNSYHHQAIMRDDLAPGLRAVAWADSDAGRLVEGVEGTEPRWLVGVQCHPERLESTPEEFSGLWAAFVQAAEAYAAAPNHSDAPGSAFG